jgi:hypothetical protein
MGDNPSDGDADDTIGGGKSDYLVDLGAGDDSVLYGSRDDLFIFGFDGGNGRPDSIVSLADRAERPVGCAR